MRATTHRLRTGAVVAILLAILLAVIPPPRSSPHGVPISASLQPVAWPPSSLETTSSLPLLFSTTSSDAIGRLPCLRSWSNFSHLARRSVRFTAWTQPRRAARAEFTLARGREAEFAASQIVQTTNLTMEEFWVRATADSAGELVYHSAPVSSWEDAALTEEVDGALDLLAVNDAPSDTNADEWPASSGPIAWMGSAGVVATPHYDKSLNLVLQVAGSKRWMLWAPDQLDTGALLMHPTAHPSRRQVRTPLLGPSAASRLSESPAIEATVHPGQLLFVPPFWTHAVEALTPSLSLSVLSPSWTEAVGSRLTWPGLPFGRVGSAGVEQRVAAVVWYLRALLPAMAPLMQPVADASPPSVSTYAERLHAARHASLHTIGSGLAEADAATTASTTVASDDDRHAWRGAGCATLQQAAWPEAGGPLPTHAELTAAVEQVVRHASRSEDTRTSDGRTSSKRLPRPVVRALMSDYVESVAAWAVGVDGVGALLRELGRCQ